MLSAKNKVIANWVAINFYILETYTFPSKYLIVRSKIELNSIDKLTIKAMREIVNLTIHFKRNLCQIYMLKLINFINVLNLLKIMSLLH